VSSSCVPEREKETLGTVLFLVQIFLVRWWSYGVAHHGREAEAEGPRRCPAGFRLFPSSGSFPISIFFRDLKSFDLCNRLICHDVLRD
jgi:hypothetical protein